MNSNFKVLNFININFFVFLLCVFSKCKNIEQLSFNGNKIRRDYENYSEINYFQVKITEEYIPKYISILITGNPQNPNTKYIISFFQQDSNFEKRTQLAQSPELEAELLLNKAQIKDKFYFTIECNEYPCNYKYVINEELNFKIDFYNRYSYTYYVTEETKEMNFTIFGKPELPEDTIIEGYNVISVWAKGNKKIISELDVNNKEEHSELNAYLVKLASLNEFSYNFKVIGEIGDLINVGVSFFDGGFHNLYTNIINGNTYEISGFLKKGIKETNCFVIKKTNGFEDGLISYNNYNNYDIELMTLITQYKKVEYYKKCLSISHSNEGFYSFQYIQQNNKKIANIYPPQILGTEYSRYILEGDIIQLIPIKPDYDYKYITFHINIGQGKKINAFINSCETYPLCDISSETIKKSQKIQNFNSFTISFSKSEFDEYSSSPYDKKQKILLIQCEKGTRSIHTNGASKDLKHCLIKINMFTDKEKFNIEPYISNYRYIQKNNENNFIVGHKNNQAEYMIVNIELFSGNISISLLDVNQNNLEHYNHGNKNLYILKEKECLIKINSIENSFYHINYILKNNYAIDYSFTIGANYLFRLEKKQLFENIILANPNSIYDLEYNDKNPIFVGFYPYNCSPKLYKTLDTNSQSIELKGKNNFYQDISNNYVENPNILSLFSFFNYTINKNEENNCLVDLSFFQYNNQFLDSTDSIILSNNTVNSFIFSSNVKVIKFSYPHVKLEQGNNIMIEFTLINEGDYKINLFFNDEISEHQYKINKNNYIIIEEKQFQNICKYDNQICKISFNIESQKENESILQIKISTTNKKDERNDNNQIPNNDEKGKNNNQLYIVLIILAIIVFIVMAILLILYIFKRKSQKLEENINTVSFGDTQNDKEDDKQLLNE